MHGRSCAIWRAERLCPPRSPPRDFRPEQLSAQETRLLCSTKSEPLPRNDLSLLSEDCPPPGHLPTVDVSGLSLRLTAKSSPSPFDPTAPPRTLVSPSLREINAEYPLPGSLSAASDVFQLLTPDQGLWTPPDQSAKLNTNRIARRIGTSRLSLAPHCLLF